MRISMSKLMLLLIFLIVAIGAWAAVNEYTFTSSMGTYTEITGGTVLGSSANDNESFNAIDLGFTFHYNDVDYTQISVQSNGFIAFGPTVATSTLAISAATGTNNVAAPLNRDIRSRDDGSLTYLLSGTAPNRVFTIQWKNYKRNPTTAANDVLNFQIQLHEAGNMVKFVYGNFTVVNVTTAATVQVGIRGSSNADFNNRSTTTDWAATTAGTANNASCTINNTVFPANGLTFTFSPVQQGTAPNAAQTPNPANNATNVGINAILSWLSGGGTIDGYKVYLGTNNPPTNLVNGSTITTTSYDHPTSFNYNTIYYWKIVPYNTFGDAPNCPVWQFTTLADPTVNTFPYTQNFDGVTPPALPLGWSTLNLNNDAYTWETYAGTPHSTPNCARIRYSTTAAMNDWLLTPPLHFTAGTNYQLKFWYRANSATYPEAMSVFWGNAPTEAALTNQLFTNSNITNIEYQQATVTIPVATTGNYYIGFKGHSPADMFYLYLDDVIISEVTDSMDPPNNLTATVTGNNVHLAWLAPGETPPPPPSLNDGFETYTDFAISFEPWVTVDVDQSPTYGITNTTWPNAYAAQAYIIFNPTATTPALADLSAHTGVKMAACFAATTPPNNDWMMSPLITPTAGQYLNFWARSYTAQYGLERFKVGISNGGTQPANFTIISGANYVSAPAAWTLYSYDLTPYAGQQIRAGIQCLSNDAFIFLVDDVTVGPIPTRGHEEYAGDFMGLLTRNTGTPVPGIPTPTINRDLLGYKIYRDGTLIHTLNGTGVRVYDDPNLAVGSYSYTVTAVYTSGESVPAGPAVANILPPMNPPANLTATVNGNNVVLNWVAPGGTTPPQGQWITWCNDVLGNGIGTGSAATFDVAHRFVQADLAQVAGGVITQVKFVPNEAQCTYTVKVWTGGSATNAGTLVSSQAVPNATIGAWNTVTLNTPVPIPTTGDVYIGYGVNTQTGHPAGCDAGPVVGGKGNMIYFNNAWQPLTQLAASLTYNWLIQTYVSTGGTTRMLELSPIAEAPHSNYPNARFSMVHTDVTPANTATRNHTGFKVYRNGNLITTITNPATVTYSDNNLAIGTYSYTVTATYAGGESTPAGPVTATIQGAGGPAPLNLTADVAGHDVTLNWESPEAPQQGQWITWCQDALGNSVGTGSAATFAVAHRFTQADLAQVAGGTITQMKMVAGFENCVYTAKVWTGGTATNAGTLVSSQPITSPVVNEWTTVVLNTPVPIPTTGDVYIGYEVNTQGGYPAGCDDGPPIGGKGNMMYFQGAWQPLTQLAASLTFNWTIKTFVATGTAMKELKLSPIAENPIPSQPKAQLAVHRSEVQNSQRAVAGFKVYRDGALIATLNDPLATTYTETGVANGTYLYGVTAVHTTGESQPATIQVVVNVQLAEVVFSDNFDSYPDFATLFAPWTLIDQDLSPTYGFSGIQFPGSESAMAYIIFNPNSTVPPITTMPAHSGNKMAASFAAIMPADGGTGPNSDWMISPRVRLGTDSSVRLFARSHTAQYGLERFRVGVSMNPNIVTGGWQWQGGTTYDQAPAAWTEFLYDISSFDGQTVRIAVRCVSEDAFVFYVDDFSIHSDGGSLVDNDDPVIPAISTKLQDNYPNPFNPETTIRFSLDKAMPVTVDIFNVKGQLVKTLVNGVKESGNHSVVWNGKDNQNRPVSSGVYYYKMSAGKYSSTRKMILMK